MHLLMAARVDIEGFAPPLPHLQRGLSNQAATSHRTLEVVHGLRHPHEARASQHNFASESAITMFPSWWGSQRALFTSKKLPKTHFLSPG